VPARGAWVTPTPASTKGVGGDAGAAGDAPQSRGSATAAMMFEPQRPPRPARARRAPACTPAIVAAPPNTAPTAGAPGPTPHPPLWLLAGRRRAEVASGVSAGRGHGKLAAGRSLCLGRKSHGCAGWDGATLLPLQLRPLLLLPPSWESDSPKSTGAYAMARLPALVRRLLVTTSPCACLPDQRRYMLGAGCLT
jgi:hypothetical protein